MKIPGQPEGPVVTTRSGEEYESKIANIVQGRIAQNERNGKVAFDARTMWCSANTATGWVTAQITFPYEVELTRIVVHSQHSGQYHIARAAPSRSATTANTCIRSSKQTWIPRTVKCHFQRQRVESGNSSFGPAKASRLSYAGCSSSRATTNCSHRWCRTGDGFKGHATLLRRPLRRGGAQRGHSEFPNAQKSSAPSITNGSGVGPEPFCQAWIAKNQNIPVSSPSISTTTHAPVRYVPLGSHWIRGCQETSAQLKGTVVTQIPPYCSLSIGGYWMKPDGTIVLGMSSLTETA